MIYHYQDSSGFSIKRNKRWIAKISISKDFGKWLVYSKNPENLSKYQKELNELVENGEIEQIKFINAKKLNALRKSLLPKRKRSFLCIYCWRKNKTRVKKIIEKIGLKPKEWKSNFQTTIDWLPGGKLYEEVKKTLPKRVFEKRKKEIISRKYWSYIRPTIKKYLSQTKYQIIRKKILKELSKKTSSYGKNLGKG